MQYKIHREGHRIIFYISGILAILLIILNLLIPDQSILHYFLYVCFFALWLFVTGFFRYKNFIPQSQSNEILSPADGKIVVIEEVLENEYFNEKRVQVSIFMSPFNTHVNRYPISGKVEYVKYHPGKYLIASHPKSSELNERNSIIVNNPVYGKILFRQIAGIIARRIVCYSKENDNAEAGDEMGFIKFGSRLDVFLPLNTNLKIKLGDKVKAGKSIIATF